MDQMGSNLVASGAAGTNLARPWWSQLGTLTTGERCWVPPATTKQLLCVAAPPPAQLQYSAQSRVPDRQCGDEDDLTFSGSGPPYDQDPKKDLGKPEQPPPPVTQTIWKAYRTYPQYTDTPVGGNTLGNDEDI